MATDALTGANAITGLKVAGIYGTAATIGAGDKVEYDSFTPDEATEELTSLPLGSGQIMANDSQRGGTSPKYSMTGNMNFNDAKNVALAQMFGGASVAQIATGVYAHSILVNETANQKWITIGNEWISGSVLECASAAVTSVKFNSAPVDYVKMAIEMLGNEFKIASTTNTFAGLETATVADSTRVVCDVDDEFLLNLQSAAALATGTDRRVISSYEFSYDRPQEHIREIRGAAGNGEPAPGSDIPLQVMVTLTLKELADNMYFTAHQAGTEYKARLTLTGGIAAGSTAYLVEYNFPRLKVVVPPQRPIANAGNNPVTVVLKALVASSAPSGMLSVYPYMRIVNTRSTAYLG